MCKNGLMVRLVLGAALVLAGFVAREAVAPREAEAQLTTQQEEQLGTYEVTYAGNDGVWTSERFERSLYAVQGGALVILNPFTNQLFKAYSAGVWITVREIAPE